MKTYLVGGAVRDKLLGLPIKERDWVVVGATPADMEQLGYKQVGKDFPVFIHPTSGEEYALARTERKTGSGYYGFECYSAPDVTLEDDLKRRDLTVNAIAQTESGEIIDPFNGQKDLKNRLLRHVSPAFSEDPVRILRAARFAARFSSLGFKVVPETLQLMREMVAQGEVGHLVSERVWQELQRALTEATPSVFFRVLREAQAAAVIFPEIDQLFGIPNPEKWHPEIDSGEHILLVIDSAAKTRRADIVFAALVHDLGKIVTPKELWPSHPGHEEAGVPLVKAMCERLRVPNDYKELSILACRYHQVCHRALEEKPSTLLNLLEHMDAFRRPERFYAFLEVAKADSQGRTGYEDSEYPQADRLLTAYQAAKAVPVKDIMDRGFTGEAIAKELHQLRVEAIRSL